jgi:hypothetical protein
MYQQSQRLSELFDVAYVVFGLTVSVLAIVAPVIL